jgi:2-polyprenyl-3-methyl-5-hydroxy-6-metoxy-1,4-benzoquinol methylase
MPTDVNNFLLQSKCTPMDAELLRKDFDEIARLAGQYGDETDRYGAFLLSLVPPGAALVLDIGCGLGRLTCRLANGTREVVGVDLSPEMIARARQNARAGQRVSFVCGNFLAHDFGSRQFDCVISSAVLHHLQEDVAVQQMLALLRPGGRLVIHDLRSDSGMLDHLRSHAALAQIAVLRLIRTGRPRSHRAVREAWLQHGTGETYLTLSEAQTLANRLLPGSGVYSHWLWRYTIVWTKPEVA